MRRTQHLLLTATLLFIAPSVPAQSLPCGDCDGNGLVDVMDAFTATRHAVQIITLSAGDFTRCNIVGDPGPPTFPGMPMVNVLDALRIAQFSVGLPPALSCSQAPVPSAGPYDVRFNVVPTETASGQPFELTVVLFDLGTSQLVIPTSPLLVTLSRNTGAGTLSGSVRQWMTQNSQVFGNLSYNLVETYTLRASAGAPHSDGISGPINNVAAVVADVKGGVVMGAGPHPAVRFNFVANNLLTPVTGTFNWDITDVATTMVVASGTIPLSAVRFANVPVASLPSNGLYRVFGEIAGTVARDVYPLVRGAAIKNTRPTLSSGRVGVTYDENIMDYVGQASGAPGYTPMTFGPYTSFLLLGEELPPGLSLNAGGMGNITGTPTRPGFYVFTAFGIDASFNVTRMVTHVAIFSFKDTEVQSGLDLSGLGPYVTSEFDSTYNFTNWWDCSVDSTTTRFYFPTDADDLQRLPMITFIHGNGFRYDFYNDLFRSIASYGYLVGSVDNPGYPQQGCTFCSTAGAGGPGYSRATGFQDSVIDKFVELNAGTLPGAPGSAAVLVNKLDFDNVFYSGHSRGGSTTLCNLKWKPWVARGAVPSMQVDPKAQGCLGLSDPFPALPLMSFFAEDDGDVVYPLAEASMEDKQLYGMTTSITLYGACHGHFADTAAGGCAATTPTASRARVKQICRNFFTAFVQRHSRGDLRLEGQLYLNEHQSSDEVGVYGARDMNRAVYLDNHQATGAGTNQLGGVNSAVTLTISEENTMPTSGASGRSIVHRRFGHGAGTGTNTWSAPVGTPINATDRTWLVFRCRQYNCTSQACLGSVHWTGWLTNWEVTLVDAAGQRATINMQPLFPPATALAFHQRWHRYAFQLDQFRAINPALNIGQVQAVEFRVGPAGTSTNFTAADDVRIE